MKQVAGAGRAGAIKPRDGFATGLGVIAATLGSAIGLGERYTS